MSRINFLGDTTFIMHCDHQSITVHKGGLIVWTSKKRRQHHGKAGPPTRQSEYKAAHTRSEEYCMRLRVTLESDPYK